MNYLGMNIQFSPLVPQRQRIQLSRKLADIIGYSMPEFVEQTNAWLLDRFGTVEVAYIFQDPFTGEQIAALSDRIEGDFLRAMNGATSTYAAATQEPITAPMIEKSIAEAMRLIEPVKPRSRAGSVLWDFQA